MLLRLNILFNFRKNTVIKSKISLFKSVKHLGDYFKAFNFVSLKKEYL